MERTYATEGHEGKVGYFFKSTRLVGGFQAPRGRETLWKVRGKAGYIFNNGFCPDVWITPSSRGLAGGYE